MIVDVKVTGFIVAWVTGLKVTFFFFERERETRGAPEGERQRQRQRILSRFMLSTEPPTGLNLTTVRS